MRETPIDDMIAFVLEELLSGSDERRRSLVRVTCARWPGVPALAVPFALTSAAAMIEDNFREPPTAQRAEITAYRLAALVAADIYAVESMGHKPATARDLLHFWRRVDPYFLEL